MQTCESDSAIVCRFLLISVREGTQPTNQLWYVDLQGIPQGKDSALDFAPFDFNSGPEALPVVKLVDDFEAAYEYVANEGMAFTFQTNYQAPLYRSALFLDSAASSMSHDCVTMCVLSAWRLCSRPTDQAPSSVSTFMASD